MHARNKLNAAHLNGTVITAAVIGAIAQSWLAFIIALAVLVTSAFLCGDIRLRRRQ